MERFVDGVVCMAVKLLHFRVKSDANFAVVFGAVSSNHCAALNR